MPNDLPARESAAVIRIDGWFGELYGYFCLRPNGYGHKETVRGAQQLRGTLVLLVDDESAFRLLVGRLLARGGFSIAEANSGDEALRLLDTGLAPDAVLLDYRMPGLNGGETLKELRLRGLQAPVVLVSAATNVRELATQYGFDGALEKPCSTEEIQQLLAALLAAGSKERARH